MKTYVFTDYASTYKIAYLTNGLDGMGNLFINAINSEVNNVKSIGLCAIGQTLGLPEEGVQTTERALMELAVSHNLRLEAFDESHRHFLISKLCVLSEFVTHIHSSETIAINQEAKTIAISISGDNLPETGLNGLKPTFVTSEGAIATINDEPQVSGVSSVDFEDQVAVTYVVKALDGVTEAEYAVTITVVYK